MKENVICGHLIPAGTGLKQYERIIVGSKDDIEALGQYDEEEAANDTVEIIND
jgi:DNA-directed RNA polymerase subunit beta'